MNPIDFRNMLTRLGLTQKDAAEELEVNISL
jgi:hypothetical protein